VQVAAAQVTVYNKHFLPRLRYGHGQVARHVAFAFALHGTGYHEGFSLLGHFGKVHHGAQVAHGFGYKRMFRQQQVVVGGILFGIRGKRHHAQERQAQFIFHIFLGADGLVDKFHQYGGEHAQHQAAYKGKQHVERFARLNGGQRRHGGVYKADIVAHQLAAEVYFQTLDYFVGFSFDLALQGLHIGGHGQHLRVLGGIAAAGFGHLGLQFGGFLL